MAVALAESPILQFLNNAGQPNAGGTLLTQVGGVNYPTYQDAAGSTALPNPIPLNSRGEVSNSSGVSVQLFLSAGVNYTFTLFDALGNQLWTAPAVIAIAPVAVGSMTDEKGSDGNPGFLAGTDFTPGTSTTLTLSQNYGSASNLWIAFDAAPQGAGTFSLSGTNNKTLTFNAVIPVGTTRVFVKGGTALTVGAVSAGAITDAQVAAGANINSSKLSFTGGGAGAVARTVQIKLQEVSVNIDDFAGADPTGALDSTTPALNAIARVVALGGGYVDFGPGTYKISQTLNLNNSGVKLRGVGYDGNHDSGNPQAITNILWNGAAAATMIQIGPGAGATQRLSNNGLTGIYLDSNNGLAGIGLNLLSSNLGTYDFAGNMFTNTFMQMGVTSVALSESADPQYNTISLEHRNLANSGSILICNGSSSANTSFNYFPRIHSVIKGSNTAILLNNADNCYFNSISIFGAAPVTGFGLVFAAGTGTNFARANVVNMYSSQMQVVGQGTAAGPVPATNNQILFWDVANYPINLGIGVGASLWVGSNNAPVGQRTAFSLNANNNMIQYADGRIRYSGLSGAVAAGGNLTITFPTGFTSSAIAAGCTPTSGNPCWITVSATGIVINNTGGGAANYWWFAEGI